MKKLLLLTSIFLCSGSASIAATHVSPSGCAIGVCEIANFSASIAPQDSAKMKLQIKKANLKKVELKEADNLKLIDPKSEGGHLIDGVPELEKGSSKAKAPHTVESKTSAEEMKSMAKRESGNAKKKPTRPAVSYPSYPGGNFAIREFVKKNQQYPEECKRERARGRVEVIIAIAPDGTPHSATISKSSGNVYMDAEALRIAELMPKWTPAGESDDPQGTECVIFVNFRPGR